MNRSYISLDFKYVYTEVSKKKNPSIDRKYIYPHTCVHLNVENQNSNDR